MLNFAINDGMGTSDNLPPFLINNPSKEEMSVMTNLNISKRASKKQDFTGRRFGRLIVVEDIDSITPLDKKYVRCLCDCGNYKTVSLHSIKYGHTKSCGCLFTEMLVERNTSHNRGRHPIICVLYGMRSRCQDAKNGQYEDYGGRGVTICKEWENPENFFQWAMASGWCEGLNIDRKDPDGDYEPSNCRFVDNGLNSRNTRVLRKDNTSGYRGVFFKKKNNKWVAQISANSKRIYIGLFDTAIKAAKAYDAKARELDIGHPLNFDGGL